MPIIVNLDIVMAKRKMSLTDLAEQVGITMANLSILKKNHARAIRFSTLERLCRILDCKPGDLLEYEEGQVDIEAELAKLPDEDWDEE